MATAPRKLLTRLRRVWSGSIQRRLTIGITVLFAAAMSAFVLDLVKRQHEFLRQQNHEEAQALANTLAANSVSWVLASDLAGLQEVILTVKHYPDLRYAMILERDGRVLAHTDATRVGRYADDAISRTLRDAAPETRILVNDAILVDLAAPIRQNGNPVGWARVSLGQSRVDANLRAVARNGLAYAAIAIGLSVLFAALMVRGLTRDLTRLVGAARRIGAGERGVQSGLAREDELGELSGAIDAMASDLDGATRELQHSEASLKEAQRIARVGNWELDLASNVLTWTEELYRIFEIDPAAFGASYEAFLATVHPDDRAFVDKAYTDSVKNATPYDIVHRLLMKDGRVKFVNERCETTYDAAGRPLRSLGTTQDVTERKLAEEKLRLANAVVESSPTVLFRWSTAPGWPVEYVSDNVRQFGYEASELTSGTVPFANLVHPEDLARVAEEVARYCAQGAENFSQEYRIVSRDGKERWVDDRTTVERDAAGTVVRLQGVVTDISARKRAQQAELEQFRLAEAFFSHSVTSLVVLDRNFNFVRVNEAYAKACRRPIGEFAGRNHFEMYPSDTQAIFEEVVRSKRPFTTFTRAFVFADQPERGTTYWDWTLVPVLDAAGEVEYLVFSLNDVTERKQAQSALERSERHFRKLIEGGAEAFFVIDRAGTVVYRSPTGIRLTGWSDDEVVGKSITAFVLPEHVAGARAAIAETIRNPEGTTRVELRLRRKDGTALDIEASGRNLLADPDVGGIVVTIHDITERKQAEAARAQLAAIVQSSNDAIIGKDLGGIITTWNPGAEKVYGYRADEVVGRPVSVLAPEGRKDEIPPLLDTIARGGAVASFETERIRKDGARIDVALALSPIKDASGRITGVSTIARDITDKKQAERALRKVNRALKALSHCNTALIHATDEVKLLNEMCRVIVEIAGYRLAWVGYVEHDAAKTVRLVAQSGYAPGFTAQPDITWEDNERGRGPLGIAVRTGQIQVVQDVMTDGRFGPWRTNAARLGYGSVLVAPLLSGSRVIGALSINAEGAHAFDEAEIDLLSELAADMAYGIVTLRLRVAHEESAQRTQRGMEATIGAIAGTVEMRDPYTAGHQRRVAELAVAIGRELGLTEDRVRGLHLAGVVHDLGKIHIPAEILSKPGKLSRIEYELIKGHPQSGYDILKGIDFPWPIALSVLQHHERIDGSGYPGGLKGDQILFEAKILAVADVVEAMASHRPYRPSLGIEPALREIAANAGKLYDPEVARACIALFREKRFVLPESFKAA